MSYEANKIFNQKLRKLAEKLANKKFSAEELKKILFWAAASGSAMSLGGIEYVEDFETSEYWEYPESPNSQSNKR